MSLQSQRHIIGAQSDDLCGGRERCQLWAASVIRRFRACRDSLQGRSAEHSVRPSPGDPGDPDPFLWSGFGDTLDQLMAQNIKGISILVERLYTG